MHQDIGKKPFRKTFLINLITEWIQSYHHLETHPLYTYKFDLKNIQPLPQNLLINAISYAFYAIFPFLIEDLTTDFKIQSSFELKMFYSQQFYEGKWKKEFIFQFTMVYLTKTISWFIEDHFPTLEINENLQSQIFIILFKVFIGTEVGTKIYNVTAKKYVRLLNSKIPKKVDIKVSIAQSMLKKSTPPFSMEYSMKQSSQYLRQQIPRDSLGIPSMAKLPQPLLTPNKPLQKSDQNSAAKRYLTKNRISLLRSRMQPREKSAVQIFNEQLKSNLRVEAFKKVADLKYDIGDYEEMGLAANKRQQQEKQQYDPLREARKQKRHKTNQISSGKMSQSMQVNLHLHQQPSQPSPPPPKFYYPINHNIISGKKLSITRQMSFKNSYTLPLQKAHSLCEGLVGDVVERKSDKDCGGNAKSMVALGYKNRNKSQGRLTLGEWNQVIREMKVNVKNADSNKEHRLVNRRSFHQHRESNAEQSLQAQQPKMRNLSHQRQTHSHFSTNETTNATTTLKLKPQLNQSPMSRQKSASRSNLKDDEFNQFRKIDIFTATSGQAFQMPERKEQSVKIKSRTINMGMKSNPIQGERLHKKSKTRILRQSKIQFLTECKKREQNLHQVVRYIDFIAKSSIP